MDELLNASIIVWVRNYGCYRENSGETCCSRPSETDSPRWDMQKQARVTLEL